MRQPGVKSGDVTIKGTDGNRIMTVKFPDAESFEAAEKKTMGKHFNVPETERDKRQLIFHESSNLNLQDLLLELNEFFESDHEFDLVWNSAATKDYMEKVAVARLTISPHGDTRPTPHAH